MARFRRSPMPKRAHNARWWLAPLMTVAVMLLTAGCTGVAPAELGANPVPPVAEEQILNVVEDFYVRQPGLVPEYEAEIEQVERNWARVSIRPVGVELLNGPDIIYLQNQAEAARDVETPTVELTPPRTARVETDTGWTIVAGPQAQFTDEELNAAGIPAYIRP